MFLRSGGRYMKIARLDVHNYRTLESLDLAFPSFYSAICGRNDSGKTNVVTAIKRLVQQEGRFYYGYPFPEKPEFFFKDDFTKWIESEPKGRRISVSIDLFINAARDAGIYSFLIDYLGLETKPAELSLSLSFEQNGEGDKAITVRAGGQNFDGLKAEEVLTRFRTSPTFLFHSSTDPEGPYQRGSRGALRETRRSTHSD
jgi:putative ATP-dependent endonuclease of the OLD family